MLININGLPSKLNMLAENSVDNQWDIICVTETHLLPRLPDSIVDIPNYIVIRHDVDGNVFKHGVCCYIRNSLIVDSVSQPLPNLLSFRLTQLNMCVLIVYRAPSNTAVENAAMASFITDFCCGKEVLVLGDFNLPAIDWAYPNLHCPPLERMFFDAFLTVGLHQWVTEPTFPKSGNTLDLVLTSEPDRIGAIEVLPPLPGCDHCAISFDYVFEISDSSTSRSLPPLRDWHRGRFRAAGLKLSNIDWDFELAYLNADQSFERFSSIVQEVSSECIPLRAQGDGKPPFSTRAPSSLITRRHNAWSRYKTVRTQLGRHSVEAHSSYASFANLNRQCRTYAVKAQASYEESLLLRAKEHPKVLHSYIRKKKVSRPTVGPLKLPSGQLSDNPRDMC